MRIGSAPGWLETDPDALDVDLGLVKTGKEADVHLVQRAVPGTAGCLLAAKRYRDPEHRMFHRDAGYQEGRTTRRTRDTRAMAGRTTYGRELLAGKWALAEFEALIELWSVGAPVPYPVELTGRQLLMEFVGDPDGTAAPRLAQCRPGPAELADLFDQCVSAMHVLAAAGYTHGDLSPYNLLVHRGRVVVIDLPQVVDLFANPRGTEYLERDCRTVCRWFAARGLRSAEFDHLPADLLAEALGRH